MKLSKTSKNKCLPHSEKMKTNWDEFLKLSKTSKNKCLPRSEKNENKLFKNHCSSSWTPPGRVSIEFSASGPEILSHKSRDR